MASITSLPKNDHHLGSGMEISFEAYVHFCYYVGLLTKQKDAYGPFKSSELVSWYCRHYPKYLVKPLNVELSRRIYRAALENMIEDNLLQKVTVSETESRLKHDPRFLLWSWKNVAEKYRASIDIHFPQSGPRETTKLEERKTSNKG